MATASIPAIGIGVSAVAVSGPYFVPSRCREVVVVDTLGNGLNGTFRLGLFASRNEAQAFEGGRIFGMEAGIALPINGNIELPLWECFTSRFQWVALKLTNSVAANFAGTVLFTVEHFGHHQAGGGLVAENFGQA